MGHPGTGILLNDTFMMCSHASAGTKETANLKFQNFNKFSGIFLQIFNSLRIALWMDLSWNVMTLC